MLNSKGVKHQSPLLHKLRYNTTMNTHNREKSTNDFSKLYCKKLTQRTNKCKYKLLKIKVTKRQNELLHAQPRSARHTGKPVENEDAGRWNGSGENINRVGRKRLSSY